jgi:hypothetical protein
VQDVIKRTESGGQDLSKNFFLNENSSAFYSFIFLWVLLFVCLFVCIFVCFGWSTQAKCSFLSPWNRSLRSSSASQEIPCILCNPNIYYLFYKSSSLVSILSQMNAIYTVEFCCIKIHSNVILPYAPRSSKWIKVNLMTVLLIDVLYCLNDWSNLSYPEDTGNSRRNRCLIRTRCRPTLFW